MTDKVKQMSRALQDETVVRYGYKPSYQMCRNFIERELPHVNRVDNPEWMAEVVERALQHIKEKL